MLFGLIFINNNFKLKIEFEYIVGKCLIDMGNDIMFYIL